MNIMVFDVPAESGGALSILEEFYGEAKQYEDKSINWIFVISKPILLDTQNIKILRYPWVKKSWVHRVYFDQFIAHKLIKKFDIDLLISLQNISIPRVKIKQIIYVHQSLPFTQYKFKITQPLLWIYQNIIGAMIKKSIKTADKVVVQSNWIKKVLVDTIDITEDKILVISPNINANIKGFYSSDRDNYSRFIYPAGPAIYKNHKVIVEACEILKSQCKYNYRVVFTLSGNESKDIVSLHNEVMRFDLPIDFIGPQSREDIFEYYLDSILIFPSYVETIGLPLLEAKLHGSPIIASDQPFSREILDDYPNALSFECTNANQLANIMKDFIDNKFLYAVTNNEVTRSSIIKQLLLNISAG